MIEVNVGTFHRKLQHLPEVCTVTFTHFLCECIPTISFVFFAGLRIQRLYNFLDG